MIIDNLAALGARDDWLWIANHWTNLRAQLVGRGGNALTGMPSGSSAGSTVIDLHVSDLIHEITENARFYARVLLEEVPSQHGCGGACTEAKTPTERCPQRVDPITTSRMPALLTQVAQRYGHFVQDEAMALGFCDDAHDYREKVRKVLERPAPPTYVGPCREVDCVGEIYVREGHEVGKCPVCGAEVTLVEQREWLDERMAERLMTPSELASALVVLDCKVAVGTIRSWISRGRLVEAMPDSGLYRLVDAKDLAARGKRVYVGA